MALESRTVRDAFRMTLMATSRPVSRCTAAYTCPVLPLSATGRQGIGMWPHVATRQHGAGAGPGARTFQASARSCTLKLSHRAFSAPAGAPPGCRGRDRRQRRRGPLPRPQRAWRRGRPPFCPPWSLYPRSSSHPSKLRRPVCGKHSFSAFREGADMAAAAGSGAAQQDTMPWVEKYRPSSLDELVAHEQIVTTSAPPAPGPAFPRDRCPLLTHPAAQFNVSSSRGGCPISSFTGRPARGRRPRSWRSPDSSTERTSPP